MTDTTSAAPHGAARTAHIGDRLVELERPNGVKATRALAELRQAGDAVRKITTAWGDFVREYEATHVIELDRVQARHRFPGRPLIDTSGDEPQVVTDEQGDVVLAPSFVDQISDEDWQAAGGKLRLPSSPSREETIFALAPLALELAEDRVYRLLALFTLGNGEVVHARREGHLDQLLDEKVAELLETLYGDELLELAVACGELVDHHFRRKASALGERLGNALRLIGLGPAKVSPTTPAGPSTTSSSSTRPTSSSDSPPPTDGIPTPPSDSPPTSSSSSPADSTSGQSEQRPPALTP